MRKLNLKFKTMVENTQKRLVEKIQKLSPVVRYKYAEKYKTELVGTSRMVAKTHPKFNAEHLANFDMQAITQINKAIQAVEAELKYEKLLKNNFISGEKRFTEILEKTKTF